MRDLQSPVCHFRKNCSLSRTVRLSLTRWLCRRFTCCCTYSYPIGTIIRTPTACESSYASYDRINQLVCLAFVKLECPCLKCRSPRECQDAVFHVKLASPSLLQHALLEICRRKSSFLATPAHHRAPLRQSTCNHGRQLRFQHCWLASNPKRRQKQRLHVLARPLHHSSGPSTHISHQCLDYPCWRAPAVE